MTRKGKGKGKGKKPPEEKSEEQQTRPPQQAPQEPAAQAEPGPSRVVPEPAPKKSTTVQPTKPTPQEAKPEPAAVAPTPEESTRQVQKTQVPPQTEVPGPKPSQPRGGGVGRGAIPKAKQKAEAQELSKELEKRLKIFEPPALRTIHGKQFPGKQTGSGGRPIKLIANYFAVDFPQGYVYHYDVDIYTAKKKTDAAAPAAPTTRRLPASLSREIIDKMVSQYKNDLKCYPAYDGNKNLYTRQKLPLTKTPQKFNVTLMIREREESFTVAIKPVIKEDGTNAVNLQPLHDLKTGDSAEIMEESVMALDVILRHGPSLKFVPVTRSFYLKPRSQNEVPLGAGREIWFGYYQSLRPGWKKFDGTTTFYVNIDKAATSFYKSQPVLNHICEVLNLQQPPARFSDSQIKFLSDQMKGLKVQDTHMHYRRKHTIAKITRETANDCSFKGDDGNETNVAAYFRVKYKPLRYPHYPCLLVNVKRNIRVPLEVCVVMDNQPCRRALTSDQTAIMVKQCAIPPIKRFQEIERSAKEMKMNNRIALNEFDIDIDLKPLKLEGRVIDPPAVEYGRQERTTPRGGQWEIGRSGFLRGATIKSWIIINFCSFPPINSLKNLAKEIKKTAAKTGMTMDDVTDVIQFREPNAEAMVSLGQRYKNLQLIIVVLRKNDTLYKHVKQVSETKMGIVTQCLVDQNAKKCEDPKFSYRFLLQLCQKINAKMGGANNYLPSDFKPKIFTRPIMIIGADVSHPAPDGNNEKYSIAAVAGSMDAGPAQYMATVELQRIDSEVRAREERILNLTVMVERLLREFLNRTGGRFLPETLIYYRDGVSEGQFGPVRDYEIHQLREACMKFNTSERKYQPKMTFIIVQKRHHFRCYPERFDESVGRAGNVPPGTIVDTDVTHPSFFDWFLCSHLGIQGTSRPAHYTVVWDDNDFDANTLQKLSFYLCHTHTRCTKSVSIPPPVLYADLMAYRAKLYITSVREGRPAGSASSSSADSDGGILPADVEQAIILNDRIKKSMFFV